MAQSSTIKEDKMQERFLDAVQALGFRFPVAKIVRDTGYNSGIVSEYLNSKKVVSEKFLREFAKTYDLDGEYLVTGKGKAPKPSNDMDRLLGKIDTLVNSIETDRETVKKRFEKVDANFATVYTELKSLSGFQDQAAHRLKLIEGRLQKLIMNDPNSGAAVLGKKRRN